MKWLHFLILKIYLYILAPIYWIARKTFLMYKLINYIFKLFWLSD